MTTADLELNVNAIKAEMSSIDEDGVGVILKAEFLELLKKY